MKNVQWNDFYKKELLVSVNRTLGYKIKTKYDCSMLADDISKKNPDLKVSESTLYRLFLYNKRQKRPYQNTLDTVAKYVGFINFEHFVDSLEIRIIGRQWNGRYKNNPEGNTLLKSCLKFQAFDPLYDYLESMDPDEEFDSPLHFDLGEDLYKALRQTPHSTKNFFDKFSALPIVRVSLFEILADPEFKINNYEYGLRRYLNGINDIQSIKGKQDYVFANSLLFRHYFKNGRQAEWERLGEKLFGEMALDESLVPEKVHIFPYSRQFAYQFLFDYFYANRGKQRRLIEDVLSKIKNILPRLAHFEKRIFFFNMADAFTILQVPQRYEEDFKNTFESMFKDLPPALRTRTVAFLREALSMNADPLLSE